ncbi:hypothetical protein V5F53_07750 [Xanthobacter sp. V4C-4]|uniref:hypothetical protein n=1 Tax=Xanthobacter cornucopiae TaxID=3119924 RepID=UPI00372B5346
MRRAPQLRVYMEAEFSGGQREGKHDARTFLRTLTGVLPAWSLAALSIDLNM